MISLENSIYYRNFKIDSQFSQNSINLAKNRLLPSVSASANFTQYPIVPGTWIQNNITDTSGSDYLFFQIQQKYQMNIGILAEQNILDFSIKRGIELAKSRSKETILVNKNSIVELKCILNRVYFSWLGLQEKRSLLAESMVNLNNLLLKTNNLIKLGHRLPEDSIELRIRILTTKLDSINNDRLIGQHIIWFKNICEIDLDENTKLTDDVDRFYFSISSLDSKNSDSNQKMPIQLKLAEQSIEVARKQHLLDQSTWLPRLTAFSLFNYTTNRDRFNFFKSGLTPNNAFVPSFSVGFNLFVPIFDRGNARNKVNSSAIQLEKFQNNFQILTKETENKNLQWKNELSILESEIEILSERLELMKLKLAKSRLLFEKGLIDLNELIDLELQSITNKNTINERKVTFIIKNMNWELNRNY